MRTIYLLALSLLLSIISSAQFAPNILNLFSDNGDKFYLYINGKLKTNDPVPTVKLNLYEKKADLKIVFLDNRMPAITQSIDLVTGYSNTYVLIKGRKHYFLEDISDAGNPQQKDNDEWHRNDHNQKNGTMCANEPLSNEAFGRLKRSVSSASSNYKMVEMIRTALDKNCLLADQAASLVRLLKNNSDQVDIAKYAYFKVYDSENFDYVLRALSDVDGQRTVREYVMNNGKNKDDHKNRQDDWGNKDQTSYSNCNGIPLENNEFSEALQTIKRSSFDDGKMAQSKMIMKDHCLSVGQIRDIIKLLVFDTNKLELAKYAYDHTYEPQKYYLVTQEFKSDFDINALTDYINKKSR